MTASTSSKLGTTRNALLIGLLLSVVACRAGTNRFTAEIISKAEPSTNISRVLWHPSGREATFLRPITRGKITRSVLYAYNVYDGTERIVFDPSSRDDTNAQTRLSLSGYQWSPSGDSLLVSGENDIWLVAIPSLAITRLTRDAQAEEFPTFSPDGQRVAYVKQGDLFSVTIRNQRVSRLTFDGGETILNGKLDWVYGEELSHLTGTHRSYEWSPDGTRIVYLRLDESPVPEYPITDFLRTRPTARRQRYPKAGDTNPIPSVRVVSVDASKPTPRIMPLNLGDEYVMPEFSWTPDSKSVAVMTMNRSQNELTVRRWNPARGKPTVLLTEKQDAWVNIFEPPRFLPDGKQFLWASEKDGWYHCWLHQQDGSGPQQVTRGPWQIEPELSQSWSGRPYELDAASGWLYFSATQKDPRERHIYRTRLDGSGFARLTIEPGTHFQKLSPDGRHLLESFSSVDQPPAIRVLREDGSVVATLDQRTDRWRDFAGAAAEFHEFIAPDGTRLYGQLTKPADFDPAKKYPVIVYVYGGPHVQVIRNQWPAVSTRNQLLAQAGYLIWSVDNRGSWGRGRAWETAIYRNMGTNELSDQLAGVAFLKSLPFADTSRLGVWGWSYGGYMTLYLLTHAPEVFRCGVAGAPVTDWKYYDTIYTERYMSTPKNNPSGYKTSSPLAYAANLKARLLLIHGTDDDNVHLQNTLNFADALIKAGRPHELQIQPGQMHGFGGEPANRYLSEQLVDFFKRHL